MTKREEKSKSKASPGANRMADDSGFYNKVLPILLIGLGVVIILIVLVIIAAIIGIIPT